MGRFTFVIRCALFILSFLLAGCVDDIPEPLSKKDVEELLRPHIILIEEIISQKDGVRMHLIPAGEFQMGAPFDESHSNEHPIHTVYLDAFYINEYEVTNSQYKRFLDETGYSAPVFWNDFNFNKPNHPVVGVSWYDAMAYAKWAGKRLPTEAEWEKAARGGLVGKKYPWGDEDPNGTQCNFADKNTDFAWSDKDADDGYQYTAPVGSYPTNGYGLYDMAGNVWEWCLDEYQENFYGNSPKENPLAGEKMEDVINNLTSVKTRRVLRGGSWREDPNVVRVARRYLAYPSLTFNDVSFRCVSSSSSFDPKR